MDKIMTWWAGLIVIYRKVALQMPGLKNKKTWLVGRKTNRQMIDGWLDSVGFSWMGRG